MSLWIWIPLALVALVVALLGWGLLRLRAGAAAARRAIAVVRLDQIDALARECERGFREAFGITLDLADLEGAAQALSTRVDEAGALKGAFEKPGFYWYFVLPVGAYVGELLRVHAGAVWKVSEEGGVEMAITTPDGEVATFPFDKVIKQATIGDPGDLYAYLKTAPTLSGIVRELAAAETVAAS